MNRFMLERIVDLNRWIWIYDLEWKRSVHLGNGGLDTPLWYTEKCSAWERERDALVCVDDDDAHLRKMDEVDRMWEDRYNG